MKEKFQGTSILSKTDLKKAADLALFISPLIKGEQLIGPFRTKDGWAVAEGLCVRCYDLMNVQTFNDYNLATLEVAKIVKKHYDLEMLTCFGPIGGVCDNCEERSKKYWKTCKNCYGDCDYCEIYRPDNGKWTIQYYNNGRVDFTPILNCQYSCLI